MSIYFDYISSIDQIAKDARSLQLIEPTKQLISPNILEKEVIYVPREGLLISDVYNLAAVDRDASVIGSDGEDVVLIDAWGVNGIVDLGSGNDILMSTSQIGWSGLMGDAGDRDRILLGEGEYWAAGDNRPISEFGKVTQSRLAGKILF